MRKYILFALVFLCLPLWVVAQTDGYDPANPPHPNYPEEDTTTYYKVVLESLPAGAGQFSLGADAKYAAGKKVNVTAYDHHGCYFSCWKDIEGQVVSTERTFSFTMPRKDVVYYAIYSYNPDSPTDPVLVAKYPLTLKANPTVAGYFNTKDGKVDEGSTQNLYAYANSGFKFVKWVDAEGTVLGTKAQLNYLMPSHRADLTAVYEYAPAVPANPGTNHWDKMDGELSVDFFTAGSLLRAMDDMVGSANRGQVTHLEVDGELTSNDWGFTQYYQNLTYIDLSKAFGVSSINARWLENNTTIKEVEIPACITTIGANALSGCSALEAIDCYAIVPPTIGSNALQNLSADVVVYVPTESVALYQAHPQWGQFSISSLKNKICALRLNLPAECADGRYKNATLELTNVKSGQKLRYVVTDRLSYTYPTLLRNTQYIATLKNASGQEIGRSDTLTIDQEEVTYTFSALKVTHDVTMTILDCEGRDVTHDVTITWTDEEEQLLGKGYKLSSQLEGTVLYCQISLSYALGRNHSTPTHVTYTVDAESNSLQMQLQALTSSRLHAKIVDKETGRVVSKAQMAASQTWNTSYSQTIEGVKNGESLQLNGLYAVPTTFRISADGYIPLLKEVDEVQMQRFISNQGDMGVWELEADKSSVTGIPTHYFQISVPEGESPAKGYLKERDNLLYTLYNITTRTAITDFMMQDGQIYVPKGLQSGDSVVVTCASASEAFSLTTDTVMVQSDRKFRPTFYLTERGKLYARFLVTDNVAVEGLLYDRNGNLVRHEAYRTNFSPSESEQLGDLLDHNKTPNFIYFQNLEDGEYTLVTVGKSTFFGSLGTLAGYASAGLQEGVDYVQNKVVIQSGVIKPVRNVIIPVFDEKRFYYTGENTKFTVNKAQIVEGNYLTLAAKVDFQEAYRQRVSQVSLEVHLHPTSPLVDGSVMVGNALSAYEYRDNVVTIPLGSNVTDKIKFCIAPQSCGNFSPDAYVRFMLDGKEVVQPIGLANYTVTDVSIWTAALISKPSIFVDGNAAGQSEIIVYDNGVEIGRTKALSDGYWSLQTTLKNCTNLSIHEIYAHVTAPSGLVKNTGVCPVEYNTGSIQAKDVDMRFFNNSVNRTVWVGFDLEHIKATSKTYTFAPGCEFVFTANLTNNSPDVVHSCIIRVFTLQHEWIELPAQYIPNLDRWVAHAKFDSHQAPIGVRVVVDADLDATMAYEEIATDEPLKPEEITDPVSVNIPTEATPLDTVYTEVVLNVVDCINKPAEPTFVPTDTLTIALETSEPGDSAKDFTAIFGPYATFNDCSCMVVDSVAGVAVELSPIIRFNSPVQQASSKAPIATEMVDLLKQRIALLEEAIHRLNVSETDASYAEEKLKLMRTLNMLARFLHDAIEDVNRWQAYISRLQPCNGLDDAQAKAALWIAEEYKTELAKRYLSTSDISSIVASLVGTEKLEDIQVRMAQYLANVAWAIYKVTKIDSRNRIRFEKRARNTWDCAYAEKEEIEDEWDPSLPYPIVEPIIDPAGYVYEGVSSNRLSGVTATAYYKHTCEDEFGDLQQDIVLWDATQYSQENPLFTDEEGLYQWDVPQGLWQVKFEKAGYQTTYSDWLPVPPPQMDVNVPMVQSSQPEVKNVRAFRTPNPNEDAVLVTFDKYMKPNSLSASNIWVKGIKGATQTMLPIDSITYPNLEVTIEGATDTLASQVSLHTSNLSAYDQVYLIVNREVESYAGINMAETYEQRIDIKQKLTEIIVDSLTHIALAEQKTMRIAILPTEAAAGKKVSVSTASLSTASLGENQEESLMLTLDENGQAEFSVNGVLYGETAVFVKVEGEDLQTRGMISVVDAQLLESVESPIASRMSGTALYKGQTVSLSCETEGTTIYYTLDGSCPCDATKAIRYSKPIPIQEETTLKVMAVGYLGQESEVNEYHYTLRQSEVMMHFSKGWNWVSHDQSEPLHVKDLKNVTTSVLTKDSEETVGATTSMKVQSNASSIFTCSGVQYNPQSEEIQLTEGWNWLGYPLAQELALTDALAFLHAEEGDVIAQLEEGFSVYTSKGWQGDVHTIRPGKGYMYKSVSNKAFIYNVLPTVNANAVKSLSTNINAPWAVDVHAHPDMMCVIGNLYERGHLFLNETSVVAAFVGDDCRGIGRMVDNEIYLPVRGTEGEIVRLQLLIAGADTTYAFKEHLIFNQSAEGSLSNPVPLLLEGEGTSIDELLYSEESPNYIYNMAGVQMKNGRKARGIFIIDGKKILTQ